MRTISFSDKFFLKYDDKEKSDVPREVEYVHGAQTFLSPNHDERPSQVAIDTLVIHNISLPPGVFGGDEVIQLFTNTLDVGAEHEYQSLQGLRVSSHFFIRRDGKVVQFVPCQLRAWHAGDSLWRGRAGVNDFSIGIEMEGSDTTFFTKQQYSALAELSHTLIATYPIVDIVGHSDIAPARKTDPGQCFDWENYYYIMASLT